MVISTTFSSCLLCSSHADLTEVIPRARKATLPEDLRVYLQKHHIIIANIHYIIKWMVDCQISLLWIKAQHRKHSLRQLCSNEYLCWGCSRSCCCVHGWGGAWQAAASQQGCTCGHDRSAGPPGSPKTHSCWSAAPVPQPTRGACLWGHNPVRPLWVGQICAVTWPFHHYAKCFAKLSLNAVSHNVIFKTFILGN